MLAVSFKVDGLQEQTLAFNRFGKGVRSPFTATGWGKEIASNFLELESAQFATQGGRTGKPWAALSPRYAAAKAITHPGAPILVRSGKLRAALTSRSGAHVEKIRPDSIELGANDSVLPYHRFHSTGTRFMPRRSPIQPTEADRIRWLKFGQKHLVALHRGSVGGAATFGSFD